MRSESFSSLLEEMNYEASRASEFCRDHRGGWGSFGEHLDRTAAATGKVFAV
jgi:N6-adenosine-specific RNA methylase IME4